MRMEFELSSIAQAAKAFWQFAGNETVFAFHGQMGAGKTTFIHALCDAKGVKDAVGSPTFSIINEYQYVEEGIEKRIYHIDLFRLKDEAEAIQAGVEDGLISGNICLVEWPERASLLFPAHTVDVYIDLVNDQVRSVKIGNN
jgi:tRNA threonylcarbamoyladenosine biosynthesis protein TsaE